MRQPPTLNSKSVAPSYFSSFPKSANYHGSQTLSKLLAVFLYLTIARHESHTHTEKKNIQSELTLFLCGSPTSLALVQHLLETATNLSAQLFRDFPPGPEVRRYCPNGERSYFSILALNTISQRNISIFYYHCLLFNRWEREKNSESIL